MAANESMNLSLRGETASAEAAVSTGRAIFVDKDGTLVEDVPYNVDPAKLRFTPHALEGLRLLSDNGYKIIVITNQPGLAWGYFDRAALTRLSAALTSKMEEGGVHLSDFFACPHAPAASRLTPGCLCRKPAPGMLRQAARMHGLDLNRSWMIGDILDDVEAGRRAGCRSVMLDVGNETEWRVSPLRTPHHRVPNLLEAAKAILASDAAMRNAPLIDAPSAQPIVARPQAEPEPMSVMLRQAMRRSAFWLMGHDKASTGKASVGLSA